MVPPVLLQASVDDWPGVIVDGLAEKSAMTGTPAVTVTATCWVTAPPALLTVSVYVVDIVGETVHCPETGTAPIPLSIVAVVPPVLLQASVEDCPGAIVGGLAVKLEMIGRFWPTLTVTCLVDAPPGPVTVSVYVVVCDGETRTDPDVWTPPTPLSIAADVPFVLSHHKVDDCPRLIAGGLATKLWMTGCGWRTVTVV